MYWSKAISLVALIGLGSVTVIVGPVAAAATCAPIHGRAGDSAGVGNAIGVQGVLKTPANGELSYLQGTASDIYMTDTGHEFVQAGWYIGSAPGLPTTDSPRMFVGENVGGTDELLRAGPTLGWSSYHRIEITQSSAGGYAYFYLDGTYEFETAYSHVQLGHVAVNGEVNDTCSEMGERAIHNTGLPRTLEYTTLTSTGTALHLFLDHYYSSDPRYTSSGAGDIATNYARG